VFVCISSGRVISNAQLVLKTGCNEDS